MSVFYIMADPRGSDTTPNTIPASLLRGLDFSRQFTKISVMNELTWVEISEKALSDNISQFRQLIGPDKILCPCVKANAYGHGLVETGRVFLDAGADWLGVNSLYEARELRDAGIDSPIYILGYVPLAGLEESVALDCRIVVYNRETIEKLGELKNSKKAKIHIKVETGNNRQGVFANELLEFAKFALSFENIELEGLATHFANIEDTTDHSYAESQLARFLAAADELEAAGIKVPIKHCGNSAATMLFPKTHFDMVRVGIASYGMWPSKETYISSLEDGASRLDLTPAFTWKAKIAQIKEIPAGEYVGYGCSYKTSHPTRLAIVPIGYYDGYDRGVSGIAHVLINGKRAPLRGRVCMNIIMVEVTDIPEVQLEDEVVLLGQSGDENISAEEFAAWAGTINYEITTRVNERIPRRLL